MRVVKRKVLAKDIVSFLVESQDISKKAKPGHFVMLRVHGEGERIPLTIADSSAEDGTIRLVCYGIGKSTKEINKLQEGDLILDLLGPLGTPYVPETLGTVVCVAGGVGAAPLFPKVKGLKAKGNRVLSILGARTKDLLILTEEFEEYSDTLYLATDDGTLGHKGYVTTVLQSVLEQEKVDLVIAIGPAPMMEACVRLAKEFSVPSKVSLNALMIDGTGMCGGCRVSVGGETKFSCVDGPTFEGEGVDFKELMDRLSFYREQEQEALHLCHLSEVTHGS